MPQDVSARFSPHPRDRVAVFVDADNVSVSLAAAILAKAEDYGRLLIRRAYGNAAKCPGWLEAPDFAFHHAGSGKNGADLLLSIHAVDCLQSGGADVLVLATADNDFSHLATHLRERGFTVIGLGLSEGSRRFQLGCSEFRLLTPESTSPTLPPQPPAALRAPTSEAVTALLHEQAPAVGFTLQRLGTLLNSRQRMSARLSKNGSLRAWLEARQNLYDVDPKGPDARVRLRKPA